MLSSIFHSVLFHRSFGKFTYQDDSSYIIGTIGYEDVDCDYIGGKIQFLMSVMKCWLMPMFMFRLHLRPSTVSRARPDGETELGSIHERVAEQQHLGHDGLGDGVARVLPEEEESRVGALAGEYSVGSLDDSMWPRPVEQRTATDPVAGESRRDAFGQSKKTNHLELRILTNVFVRFCTLLKSWTDTTTSPRCLVKPI